MKKKTANRKRKVEEYSEVMKHERASTSSLKSYIPKPKKISFELQDRDEEIILVLRQHPITQVKSALTLITSFFFIPWLLNFSGLIKIFPKHFVLAFYLFLLVIFLGLILRSFLLWFFNVYIITDERIIDVDFLSIIYKNISTAKTENIEDITNLSSGVLPSIFDYGTIFIQTAGEKTEFEFENVPHPARIAKLMNELILEEEREKIEGRVN